MSKLNRAQFLNDAQGSGNAHHNPEPYKYERNMIPNTGLSPEQKRWYATFSPKELAEMSKLNIHNWSDLSRYQRREEGRDKSLQKQSSGTSQPSSRGSSRSQEGRGNNYQSKN